jgi:hypothetical protein
MNFYMKTVTTLLNIGWICFAIFIVFTEKNARENFSIFLLFMLFITTGLLNIGLVHRARSPQSWLGLFLKRKALEEQKKIDLMLSEK